MKLLFERAVTRYRYNLELNAIIYNRSNLDEDLVKIVAENLAQKYIRDIEANSKFIKDSLDIDDFDLSLLYLDLPSLLFEFSCDALIPTSDLEKVLGRYASNEVSEKFELEEGEATITIKPIRGELKVYLSK